VTALPRGRRLAFEIVTVTGGEWRRDSACTPERLPADVKPDDFFHDNSNRGPDRLDTMNAKRVCLLFCPVREACLAFALEVDASGVWGGTETRERAKMLGRRAGRAQTSTRKAK
jgi:hypothetical protein